MHLFLVVMLAACATSVLPAREADTPPIASPVSHAVAVPSTSVTKPSFPLDASTRRMTTRVTVTSRDSRTGEPLQGVVIALTSDTDNSDDVRGSVTDEYGRVTFEDVDASHYRHVICLLANLIYKTTVEDHAGSETAIDCPFDSSAILGNVVQAPRPRPSPTPN
jgi:hypothetical protein